MKRNCLLALTFLLTHTTSLWAMDCPDEEINYRKDMEQLASQYLSYIPHRPPAALAVQEASAAQALDPLEGIQPGPAAQTVHPAQTVHTNPTMHPSHLVQESDPNQGVKPAAEIHSVQKALVPQTAALFSEEIEGKILRYLQDFGLPQKERSALCGELSKIVNAKFQIPPFSLASKDPYFIATALWRAHQELANQGTAPSSLALKSMLFCLLTKDFSSKNKNISLNDAQLVKSLIWSNPYFNTLEFFTAKITDTHLIQMGVLPHLREFLLYENAITNKGVEVLLTYPRLEKLILSKNNITPQGVALLAQSPTLLHLELYKVPVGDKGAESLSRNTILTFLNLRAAGIGDPGAQALSTHNKTLRDLNLRENQITDKGARFFLQCHHLNHLDVGHNHISKDLAEFLSYYLMHSNGYLNALVSPNNLLSLPQSTKKDRVRILSIDGGGIRGILPGGLLNYIESTLTQKTGEQFHFAQHIDLMAGTSTGGIISLGLSMPGGDRGRPKYTTQTLLDLYTTKGEEIFPAPWCCLKSIIASTYSPKGIEKYLNEYFEENYMSESVCPTLITSFDLKNNKAHVFDSLEAKADERKNFQRKGAGRATSAAPTYFPAAIVKNKQQEEFEFVDGGIYANNPTLLAIQRALQLYPHAQEYVIYSFGTGQSSKQNLSRLGTGGLIQWGENIADVLMDNAAEYTENLIKAVVQKDAQIKYTRIQPHIQVSEKEMDNVSKDNIASLLETVKQTIIKEKKVLDAIIEDFYKEFEKTGQ